jgi:hypothetical protein
MDTTHGVATLLGKELHLTTILGISDGAGLPLFWSLSAEKDAEYYADTFLQVSLKLVLSSYLAARRLMWLLSSVVCS